MSDQIKISSNAQDVLQRFTRLPVLMQKGVIAGVRRALLITEDKVRMSNRATGVDSVKFSGARSGLSSRLTSYARANAVLGFEGAIGFRKTQGFPYELSQEFGAKAKPGKAMAIPLTPEARAAGSPRQFPGKLRIVKTPRKAFLVMSGKAAGFGAMVQYILVKSIPARMKFRDTVKGQADAIGQSIVEGAIVGWREV
jgi:hypothetical protein